MEKERKKTEKKVKEEPWSGGRGWEDGNVMNKTKKMKTKRRKGWRKNGERPIGRVSWGKEEGWDRGEKRKRRGWSGATRRDWERGLEVGKPWRISAQLHPTVTAAAVSRPRTFVRRGFRVRWRIASTRECRERERIIADCHSSISWFLERCFDLRSSTIDVERIDFSSFDNPFVTWTSAERWVERSFFPFFSYFLRHSSRMLRVIIGRTE